MQLRPLYCVTRVMAAFMGLCPSQVSSCLPYTCVKLIHCIHTCLTYILGLLVCPPPQPQLLFAALQVHINAAMTTYTLRCPGCKYVQLWSTHCTIPDAHRCIYVQLWSPDGPAYYTIPDAHYTMMVTRWSNILHYPRWILYNYGHQMVWHITLSQMDSVQLWSPDCLGYCTISDGHCTIRVTRWSWILCYPRCTLYNYGH